MNPFIVFNRADWLDWIAIIEKDYLKELKEQQNIAVMDSPVFYQHIRCAFDAALKMLADPNNAYSAPEQLREVYMSEVYGR